ncbi:MAG: NAD(P)-dependent oxidoreductase [Alphaproteobacteria bacterium]|nr:NAD(P)-dependent oxidoreductase [Alphaproteobacteria bacterium]
MNLKVGVSGLGIMGGAFAVNLVKNGFQVTGYDPNSKRKQKFKKSGGKIARSNKELAMKSDVIITSLPTASVLDEVIQGRSGIVSSGKKNLVLLEASTVSFAEKERNRSALKLINGTMLDTPVSGAGRQAEAGEISIMISGPKSAYNKIKSILPGFTKIHYYVGTFGESTKLKLLINMLISVHGAAFAEAITLARASGVNLKTFQEVLKPSAGNSRVIEYRGPLMIDDEYSDLNVKTADLTIMMKDNELIEQYAKDYRVPVPVFLNSMSLTYAALSQGYGDHDPGVITRICEQMAGIPR